MSSVFLIHGEDDFLATEKLKFFKQGFVKKYGDLNISVYGNEGFSIDKFLNDVLSAPFLSEKKMVILENVLTSMKKDEQKKLETLIEKVPETTILFIFENKSLINKKEKAKDRSSFLKKVSTKNTFEFQKATPNQIGKMMINVLSSNGYSADPKTINTFAALVGSNSRIAEQEIKKLMAFRFKEKKIDSSDVLEMVNLQMNKSIFDLTDSISDKKAKEAKKILNHFVESGDNPLHILGSITGHFRNMILVKAAQENRISESKVLSETRMHAYTFKKTSQQSRRFKMEDLKNIYLKISETDIAIKTGEKEPELALDILVTKICA